MLLYFVFIGFISIFIKLKIDDEKERIKDEKRILKYKLEEEIEVKNIINLLDKGDYDLNKIKDIYLWHNSKLITSLRSEKKEFLIEKINEHAEIRYLNMRHYKNGEEDGKFDRRYGPNFYSMPYAYVNNSIFDPVPFSELPLAYRKGYDNAWKNVVCAVLFDYSRYPDYEKNNSKY
jgi:hypothetical protein